MKTEKIIKRLLEAKDIVAEEEYEKVEAAIDEAIERIQKSEKLEKKVKKLKKKNAKLKDEIEELRAPKSIVSVSIDEDIERDDEDEEEEEYEDEEYEDDEY